MSKGNRVKQQRVAQMNQQRPMPGMVQAPDIDPETLEDVACEKCGSPITIQAIRMKRVPMTHPKSGGKEGTMIFQVTTCLACQIRIGVEAAMKNLAKPPFRPMGVGN